MNKSNWQSRASLALVAMTISLHLSCSAAEVNGERDRNLGEGPTSDRESSRVSAPTVGSERSAACDSTSDCLGGFSCVRGTCRPVDFNLTPSGKECYETQCAETSDCCLGSPKETPDKCRRKPKICSSGLPGCRGGECNSGLDCGGGGVCAGTCAVTTGQCTRAEDCFPNLCDGQKGRCTLDFTACGADTDCAQNTCSSGSCDCVNPDYQPTHEVCSDPDCEGMCPFTCDKTQCVIDSVCETNDDCFGAAPLCDEGSCVECTSSKNCFGDDLCVAGFCLAVCRTDYECGKFEVCQAGECVYQGCKSDRECILQPDPIDGIPQDRRFATCANVEGLGKCLYPCENDTHCPATEVCFQGICEYIGCETDGECKTLMNLHGQVPSDATPWVSHAVCRASNE